MRKTVWIIKDYNRDCCSEFAEFCPGQNKENTIQAGIEHFWDDPDIPKKPFVIAEVELFDVISAAMNYFEGGEIWYHFEETFSIEVPEDAWEVPPDGEGHYEELGKMLGEALAVWVEKHNVIAYGWHSGDTVGSPVEIIPNDLGQNNNWEYTERTIEDDD